MSTGGSGPGSPVACATCEQMLCPDAFAACQQDGVATAGPAAGTAKKLLCTNLLGCVRATNCDAVKIEDCFCGAAVDIGTCLAGAAAGPCKAEVEAAAEATTTTDVVERFYDPAYATGGALPLRQCDKEMCLADCGGVLGGGGGTAGSGGTPGSGGAPGSGGTPGSGGAPGSGGTPGSAGTGGNAGSGNAGSVGTAPGGGGSGGAGAPGGNAGTSGAAGSGAACPDLDADGVADCRQTAVVTPGFDATTSGWTAQLGATQSLDPRDGGGLASSSSLAVTNVNVFDASGSTQAGSVQCLPASAATNYALFAQMFIPAGGPGGSAGISVSFHGTTGCAGSPLVTHTAPLMGATDVWLTTQLTKTAPPGTTSMAVKLVVVKAFRSDPLQALFDNVLVRSL